MTTYDPSAVNTAVAVSVSLELAPAGYFERDGVQVRRIDGRVHPDGMTYLKGHGKQVLKSGGIGASNRTVWHLPLSALPPGLADCLLEAARAAAVAASDRFMQQDVAL